ncbi:hypothetical protein BDR26DRAFT_919767 [Obelidium mucronatum]|nr:hypothetical protein BDR26DRAFT_919767 [Obelidium mucronatum]
MSLTELPRLISKRRQATTASAHAKDRQPSEIELKLIHDARLVFGDRMREMLLQNEELDVLWDTLWQSASMGSDEARKMTFLDFQNIKSQLPPKFHRFFKASIFLKFVPDESGCIAVLQFFNYVLRKVSLMQARLDLSFYDGDNDGMLMEPELNQYVTDLIPSLKLESLNTSVYPYYICSSVRKFFFFMDPHKRGKIAIQKILLSPILTELFELREPELPEDYERTNWFSAYSALKIYGILRPNIPNYGLFINCSLGQYLSLDTNQNGLISRAEMSKFNSGTMTDVYLDRLFDERQTGKGQLDYRTFVDLVLAIENPQATEAITYQFKLLDVKGQGYLDDFTFVEKMVTFGHEPVHVADVVNEVFDMANPKASDRITLDDLLKCGVGGTITYDFN